MTSTAHTAEQGILWPNQMGILINGLNIAWSMKSKAWMKSTNGSAGVMINQWYKLQICLFYESLLSELEVVLEYNSYASDRQKNLFPFFSLLLFLFSFSRCCFSMEISVESYHKQSLIEISSSFFIFALFVSFVKMVDAAFAGAGRAPGLELWRIEKLKPVKQAKVSFTIIIIFRTT